VPIEAFLVFPQGAPNPPVGATPPTDPYLLMTFRNAAVVPIADFSFAIENATTIGSATAGAGAGRAKLGELSISKTVDQASPLLLVASASGGHFATVQLYLRDPTVGKGTPFLAFEFQTVFITRIEWSGATAGEVPSESVHLAYAAVVMAYQGIKPDGMLALPVRGGWSQLTNQGNLTDTLQVR
jgi:type VI secretion system secreted protein Hcp